MGKGEARNEVVAPPSTDVILGAGVFAICKTPVVEVKNGTALKCNQCKRVYPIKDDIPVMLVDEATIEP